MDEHGHPASPAQRIMDGQPRMNCVTCNSPVPINALSREGQCPICREDFPIESADRSH